MADAAGYGGRHGAVYLRGILERFRRSAGVPAAASDDLAAELAPLFAALDAIDAEAAEMRRVARRRAATIADEAQVEIEQILADAKEQAEHERGEAIKAARKATEAEMRAIDERAHQEAGEIERVGRERIAPLVAAIRRCVERAPE
jgi:flagellar biosynthesis/type III secretory pathway protein FliH